MSSTLSINLLAHFADFNRNTRGETKAQLTYKFLFLFIIELSELMTHINDSFACGRMSGCHGVDMSFPGGGSISISPCPRVSNGDYASTRCVERAAKVDARQ